MKREIKFRAWDEGNKVMHFDFQFVKTGDDGNDWILFTSDKQPKFPINEWSANPYFSQQLKIMQYTGLKDKNGKEIYEGDIIITETGKTMVIDWDKKYASFVIEYDGWAFKHYFGEAFEAVYCEVVGNIYENPELL